ncbi:MAG: fumarate hydratase [Thermoproteota archaeon]
MLDEEYFVTQVKKLLRLAETCLPSDILEALRDAYEIETSELSRMQLQAFLENARLACERSLPICQDTGIISFYVSVGEEAQLPRWFSSALKRAVVEVSEEVPLRPNLVSPLSRKNLGNVSACIPQISIEQVPGEIIEISVLPKGGGSENMSSLAMLKPWEGLEGVRRLVLSQIQESGGQPCPPTIIGVGIGGGSDVASRLAKKALLRGLKERNLDPEVANFEMRLLKEANSLGIGAMGLGGRTTVLGVNVEVCDCHVASLPVAVNMHCWAARRAKMIVSNEGECRFISHEAK